MCAWAEENVGPARYPWAGVGCGDDGGRRGFRAGLRMRCLYGLPKYRSVVT